MYGGGPHRGHFTWCREEYRQIPQSLRHLVSKGHSVPAGQGRAHGMQSAWATAPGNAGMWAGGSLRMSSRTPS